MIEPAASPWAANIVLVKKKDGSYRCCIDYRGLNSVTIKDRYPLPRADDCVSAMAGTAWYSTIDLRQSYHQVKVTEADRDKTAFICPHGMYRYRHMPFGLCNAGATFQPLMDLVMAGLHLEACLVYLDDIVVYSKTAEEHIQRLQMVFERLRTAGLKLKPEKCVFLQKSVSFLGHVISEKGVATDPAKIEAVTSWPTPTSLTEVRAFTGLASYYRRFIKDFSKIAAPLHAMTKKNVRFSWSPEAQRAFEQLKEALTSPPVLAMPTDNDEFYIDCDAAEKSIGAVLSQKQQGQERVIAYASRSLDARETRYCITRKELLAVVHFLRYFKQYLLGRHFYVRTDHAALTWLRKTPEPIGQQTRWLEILEEFDFEIFHRPGARHGNADALSRRPCSGKGCVCHETKSLAPLECSSSTSQPEVCALREAKSEVQPRASVPLDPTSPAFSPSPQVPDNSEGFPLATDVAIQDDDGDARTDQPPGIEDPEDKNSIDEDTRTDSGHTVLPWSAESLKAEQLKDAELAFIYHLVSMGAPKPKWNDISAFSRDLKHLCSYWQRLVVRHGLLCRKFENLNTRTTYWQIVLPKAFREEFMKVIHSGPTCGHLGFKKTAAAIQSRAYWPSWSSDLALSLKKCHNCARYHRGSPPKQAELQTPLAGEPWERISLDITGPHPRSNRGNTFILTIIDHFSKWGEAFPLPNHTAGTVAKALITHVFSRYGAPVQILSDQGPEFQSDLFRHLMDWMGIEKLRASPYKPSTNGQVERFHRTLNSMLAKLVDEKQRDWDEHIPFVMMAYRATQHSSTGFSPNRLFLGRENKAPIDLVLGTPSEDGSGANTYDDFVLRQQQLADQSHGLVRQQLQRCAERRKATYDLSVKRRQFSPNTWVWYYNPRRYQNRSPKWQSCYTGPYLITRIIPPVNCVLQRTRFSKPFVVHYDKIKVVRGETPESWLGTQEPSQANLPVTELLGSRSNTTGATDGNPPRRLVRNDACEAQAASEVGVEAGAPNVDDYDPFSLNAPVFHQVEDQNG